MRLILHKSFGGVGVDIHISESDQPKFFRKDGQPLHYTDFTLIDDGKEVYETYFEWLGVSTFSRKDKK